MFEKYDYSELIMT
jgi:hypothetical protein